MGKYTKNQRFLVTLLLAVLIPVVAMSVNARTSIKDLEEQKKKRNKPYKMPKKSSPKKMQV